MRQENINYLAVGSFVLAMGVLLIVVLLRLTGHGLDTDTYYVEFDQIAGVEEGSPVTYGGYRIGQVGHIAPRRAQGRTQYRLLLSVQRGWTIPEDSFAHIVTPSMLSDNLVDIVEGKSTDMLRPGGTIAGQEGGNVMAMLDTVVEEFIDLSDHHLKPLVTHIDDRVARIGGHIENRIPEITNNINQVLLRVSNNADQLAILLGDTNQKHIAGLLENADQISARLSRLASSVDMAGANLDQLLTRIGKMVTDNDSDIRQAVIDLRMTLDSVARNIETVLYHLNSSSRNINEFSRQLRDNPAILLRSKTPPDDTHATP